MDITVENIGTVEIDEALETAILDKLEAKAQARLGTKGFVIKPQTDYENEIKTASETAVKKAVGEESATLYGRIDSLVAIALGETKPDKMRTRDWVEQLEKEGKLPLSEAALTKIRDSINGSSKTKDTVIEQLKQQIEDKSKADEAKDKAAFEKTVKAAVSADLRTAPVVIDASLKDAAAVATAKNSAVGVLKELFSTFYEGKQDDEGEMYFVKRGTDKPLMNAAENRPMTPTEIMRQQYPMLLTPVGHEQKGGGTGKPAPGVPGAFKSAAEIRKYAIETKGFAAYSDEYYKFIEEETKKLSK
ncbi:hypothetical protein [Spirosoma litoris]